MTRRRRMAPPIPPDPRVEKAPPGAPDFGTDGDYSPGDGGTRWLDGVEYVERREREELGLIRQRYTWRTHTGPVPQLRSGDREAAKAYLHRLEAARKMGGWTHSEWAGLYQAIAKWKARAEGNDPRFNLVGNQSGGLHPTKLSSIRQDRAVVALKAEIAKFGSRGD